jgi:hypothetical protein
MSGLIVRTSSKDWLPSLAAAYRARTTVTLIDDAQLGVDPINQTLLEMGLKASLSAREWSAVLIGLGVSAMGAYLLVMAIVDPEPFSKISFAIGTGAALAMGGAFSSMRVLTGHNPPTIRVLPNAGFEIAFE